MIIRVHNAHLPVRDMARAVAFYRDVLGLTMRFESPYWAEFEVSGFTLGLQYIGETEAVGNWGATIDFEVAEMVPAIERLKEHGATFVATVLDQPFGKLAKFRDPDGNLLGLFEQAE